MRLYFTIIFLIAVYTNLSAQTITQEVSKISFVKEDYFRNKDNSLISFINYRIYNYPDSSHSTYSLVISTVEAKKVEVGSSSGASVASAGGIMGLGFSFNTFYSNQVLEGVCEVKETDLPKLVEKFNSILSTTGEYKIALAKQKVSSLLITEVFNNLTFGSEIKANGVTYYFKIDKAAFILTEADFFQIAKFIAKVKVNK
ncbi:hypothetical protein [Emticicia fontis]